MRSAPESHPKLAGVSCRLRSVSESDRHAYEEARRNHLGLERTREVRRDTKESSASSHALDAVRAIQVAAKRDKKQQALGARGEEHAGVAEEVAEEPPEPPTPAYLRQRSLNIERNNRELARLGLG